MNTNIRKIVAVSAAVVASMFLSAGLMQASTFMPLTARLGVGSTGANVTNLQNFLASNSDIYPSGRVTGYYGAATKAAVQQYQLSYGINMLGNVGPATFASINNTMARGYGIDVYGPGIYSNSVSVQKTYNSATVNWTTNEFASGKVFYSTSPFIVAEAIGNFTEPSIFGGSVANAATMQTSQSVAISNLQSNTLYYYIIEASDASGNVSVTNMSTFVTN